MPTGYTQGILDGTIKDLKGFAEVCSRAYLYHMREEPFDTPYKKKTVSAYHSNAIVEIKEKIEKLKMTFDEGLVYQEKTKLLKRKAFYKRLIKKTKEDRLRLEKLLLEANEFIPPTEEHHSIKNFMVEQLQKTIEDDCDVSYYNQQLQNIAIELDNICGKTLRSTARVIFETNIRYHKKELAKEKENCAKINRWYVQFIKALK